MSDHEYNRRCGCPGCQFMAAAEDAYTTCGPPLKIGEFTPIIGDFAQDRRHPNLFRTWDGSCWRPIMDDSTLPEPPLISQTEIVIKRKKALALRQQN